VYACPHDAAIRVHPREFFADQFRQKSSAPIPVTVAPFTTVSSTPQPPATGETA
jgi:hypothetical protein